MSASARSGALGVHLAGRTAPAVGPRRCSSPAALPAGAKALQAPGSRVEAAWWDRLPSNLMIGRQEIRAGHRRNILAVRASAPSEAAEARPVSQKGVTYITTSVTAKDVKAMKAEIQEAVDGGADIVEIRLDFLDGFDPNSDVKELIDACPIPKIVTLRPTWEGGHFDGDEEDRISTLKLAATLGAEYVDVELLAAEHFFAEGYKLPEGTKCIMSNHDFEATPSLGILRGKIDAMWESGADIAKLATTATDISHSIDVLSLIAYSKGPTIALAMGERGVVTRLLAPKYNGYLTFAALEGRPSAPGQPTLREMRRLYRAGSQGPNTRVFGIVGNPVSHSRSPVLHNAAMESIGFDGVYVPLLVDDMKSFLEAFSDQHFAGFSVTIPHKEAALENADKVDPVAASIGAVNTLIRQEDGTLDAYNTDWEAAINAIEDGLGGRGSLKGKTVVVLGAGGAGKALAFGAAERGAHVIVANRNLDRAQELVKSVEGAEAVNLAEVTSGKVSGDVLANTTVVGMHPMEDESPVQADAVSKYSVVFDAIYTPMETKMLKEAAAAGVMTVSGLEMFVGQAVKQFEYFTKTAATPEVIQLMRQVVVDSLAK